jgi:thioredoxin 2
MDNRFALDDRGILLACPQCGTRNRLAYEKLGQAFRCGQCHLELSPPDEPVVVGSEAIFNALTGHFALPVLMDFWAEWCGPCKMVAPELVKVAAEGRRQWLIAKVNTDELPGPSHRFGINSIPTFVLFRAGRELGRTSGAMPAAAIRQFIQQHQNL